MGRMVFVAGLPRSGSTLLMNVLGQNPAHHVTPTSGLIELFINTQNAWKGFSEFQAEGLETVKPRIVNAMGGFLRGYFKDEFEGGRVIFEKNRSWPRYIEEVEQCLEEKITVIMMVRNVADIGSSFEHLYRNKGVDWAYGGETEIASQVTIEGRIKAWFSDAGMVGHPINIVRDAIQRKEDRLMIVPYELFINHPDTVLDSIHTGLELPKFKYDTQNVRQITHEDDTYYGMNLHKVKSPITPQQTKQLLTEPIIQELNAKYADINTLAASNAVLIGEEDAN